MTQLVFLTRRNIKLFLRDKSTVFFSLLSAIIILALFILFLGKVYTTDIYELTSQYNNVSETTVEMFIFSWVLAGIIVLNSLSIPCMMLSRAVIDKEQKATNDFYVIPFKRSLLGLSYMLSAVIVGIVISFFSFLIGEAYIYIVSGTVFSLSTHVVVLGMITFSSFSFSSFMFFVYLFVKTSSTIGGITAITSSIGGFLAGIYIAIGSLSGITKDIISANPLAHATTMVRNALMLDQVDSLFIDVPTEVVTGVLDSFAVNLYVGNTQLTNVHFIVSLSGLAIVSLIVSYFKLKFDTID